MNYQNNRRTSSRVDHFTKGNGEVFLDSCGGNLEKAIRKLKKQLKNELVMETLRAKMFYEKPSIKRRRRKSNSIWRTKNNKN